MADKKIDKALYGPSVTEVALGAVLGLLAGVVAAAVFLVFKPVATVKAMPEGDKVQRSMVYYVQGSESSAKSKSWQAKQKQFLAGTAVSVVEDELNAWSAASGAPAPAAPPKGAPKAKTPDKPKAAEKPKPKADDKADDSTQAPPDGFVIPYAPNFKVVGDKLQVGLKCTLNWYGLTYDTTVLATGTFKNSGDGVVFSPEKVYLGSCPLHLLPALSGLLVSHIEAKEKVSDEVRTAWTKLTAVTIEGGALKLSVQ
jgi:hypothetical protein